MRKENQTRVDLLILGVIILLGLVLRLDSLVASNFIIDADEGIVGLMAKHISEGRGVPVFYYGQHYMGSLEAILISPFIEFFCATPAVLKIVPLLFSLGLIWVVYFIGLEVGGGFVARVAALLIAVAPSPLIVWSTKARGGFIELVFIGAVALWLTCRWLKKEQPRVLDTVVLGLVLGVGWWVNNQIIYFLPPIGFFLLAGLWKRSGWGTILRHLLSGLAAFIVGGAPFWIYNLNHRWISFEMFKASDSGELGEHLSGLFTTAIPIILGAKRFWEAEDLFPHALLIVSVTYALLLLILITTRSRELRALFGFQVEREKPVELLLLFVVTSLAVFTLSSFGYLVQAPRYLLPIYVGLDVLVAVALSRVYNWNKALGLLGIGVLLGINLASGYWGGRVVPGEPFVAKGERVARDNTELVAWLGAHNVSWVRTNYWIGYRLAYETAEQVRFVIFSPPYQVRIPEYEIEGRKVNAEKVPYVLVPVQADGVKAALGALGMSFKEERVGSYVVLYEVRAKESGLEEIEGGVTATASLEEKKAPGAVDEKLTTRWGSAHPQEPGMTFTLVFDKPRAVRGLRYNLGDWPQDAPRGLRVEVEEPGGKRDVVLNWTGDKETLFGLIDRESFQLSFPRVTAKRVILTQLGSDPVFDWSIAEVELLK